MSLSVESRTIPHAEHRYPTLGDWTVDAHGTRHFRVSDIGDKDYEFLVLIHEMVEQHLCERDGVTEAQVDEFDKTFEAAGLPGEPGDDQRAPYYRQHQVASRIEKHVAVELGVSWDAYNTRLDEVAA